MDKISYGKTVRELRVDEDDSDNQEYISRTVGCNVDEFRITDQNDVILFKAKRLKDGLWKIN